MVYALNDLKNPQIDLNLFFSRTILEELGFKSYKALTLKAVQNKTAVLELLKKRGFGIDSKTPQGASLLHFAALAGNEDTVSLLLSLGYANERTMSGASLGHYAAQGGHVALIENLAQEHLLKIDEKDHSGAGFLLYAARGGHIDAIKRLIALGCDRNQKNEAGAGVLHYAVLKAPLPAIKTLIEELGYDPRTLDAHGDSLLHQAAVFGKASLVEYFIEQCGLNPEQPNDDEETLKDLAIHSKCSQTIALCSDKARLKQLYQNYCNKQAVPAQAIKIEAPEHKTASMLF